MWEWQKKDSGSFQSKDNQRTKLLLCCEKDALVLYRIFDHDDLLIIVRYGACKNMTCKKLTECN